MANNLTRSARFAFSVRKRVLVIAGLACYFGIASFQLRHPGPEYDEVFWGPAALGFTQDYTVAAQHEKVPFSPLSVTTYLVCISNIPFPVMLMPYWGALRTYIQRPLFSLWSTSISTIRWPAVFIGALALWLFYAFSTHLFSPFTALLVLVLLATDPSYIFYTRHDFSGAALTLFLMAAPLWCLVQWRKTRRIWPWAAAFFLFGLGIYNRVDYLAFLVPLAIAVLILGFRKSNLGSASLAGGPADSRSHSPVPISRRVVILAAVCWTAGVSPFLLFVWQRPSIAASSLTLAAPEQQVASVVRLKGYVLWTVLNGTSMYDFWAGRSGVNVGRVVTPEGEKQVGSFVATEQVLRVSALYSGTLAPYCLVFLALAAWFLGPPRMLQGLGILLASQLLCIGLVHGAVRGHHFVTIVPVSCAFIASSLGFAWQRAAHRSAKFALALIGLALIASNVLMDGRYHRLLATTGGQGIWSEAIYGLSQYLQERCSKQEPCFLGDWGLGTQVVTLAGRALAVEEIFWPYLQRGNEESLNPLLHVKNARFVFYFSPYENFSRPKRLFFAAAKKDAFAVNVDRVFCDGEGTPVIEVLKVENSGYTQPTSAQRR